MSSSRTLRGAGLFAAGAALLLLSGTRHAPLIELRQQEHLQEVAPEDTTPLVAITTVAFGGFRGLVADALWVRANKLQEEGQFFELVQLARWITQLEPRVPEVWSFQAWNLAYNISVLFPEFEDRWRWVNHGLDLLRKQGLTHNPSSAALHWDIGWMFQHKIGMEFDSAHLLYKRNLGLQVSQYLPLGRLPPDTSPELAGNLMETFSMRHSLMRELDETYGPIDWRTPDAHSLYWSSRGLPLSARDGHRERMLRRMRMQSLGGMVRRGRTIGDPETGVEIFLPRLDLARIVIDEYEAFLAASPGNQYLRQGYSSFLQDALFLYAEYGRMEESFAMFQRLAELEEQVTADRAVFGEFIQAHLSGDPGDLSRDQAMIRVVALLQRSLRDPDPVRSRGYRHMAEQNHRLYQQSRMSGEHLRRTGLPPFDDILRLLQSREASS